jgi:RNA polymerase-interacting CarD/CdnL/TRCF family regulator
VRLPTEESAPVLARRVGPAIRTGRVFEIAEVLHNLCVPRTTRALASGERQGLTIASGC